jgi:kynurenine formamidase
MCETVTDKMPGWKGWLDLPAPKISGASGPWVDLSHPLTERLTRIPSFPQPHIRQIMRQPEHPANVTELHMVVHHGTHLDAPHHFIADGPTMDEVPLERLYGPGVVWRFDVEDRTVLDVADLERATPRMRPGDIVLFDTGRARHMSTERYMENASLTGEAAAWLAKQGAKIVGVDFASPELPFHLRSPDFAFPVHYTLLSQGVLIAEHVTGLETLGGHRVEIMFLGLNIVGSDGAPARPVARVVD